MTHFEHYKSGCVFGIKYRFDARGDGIPQHSHPPELAHNLIVLRGSVSLSIDGDCRILDPGVHDFDWSKAHEITALEPAETFHLFLRGQPEGYDTLPASELKGVL